MFGITGKKALVTGAGRGIGKAFALALARAGADVAVHYHSDEKAAQCVADEIRAMGRNAVILRQDLASQDCAERIFEQLKAFGLPDILVLNAAIDIRSKWDETRSEDFDVQMDCNVRSSMLLMQKAYPHMKEQGWGRIITVGSTQEMSPHPEMLVYSASKTAQTTMMRSVALRVAGTGITVNGIAPGIIVTDRNYGVLQDKEYYDYMLSKVPLGRFGTPEDCVGVLLLLCSNAGSYITGQNIYVDGAMGLRY